MQHASPFPLRGGRRHGPIIEPVIEQVPSFGPFLLSIRWFCVWTRDLFLVWSYSGRMTRLFHFKGALVGASGIPQTSSRSESFYGVWGFMWVMLEISRVPHLAWKKAPSKRGFRFIWKKKITSCSTLFPSLTYIRLLHLLQKLHTK